jgi:hypothetical protein
MLKGMKARHKEKRAYLALGLSNFTLIGIGATAARNEIAAISRPLFFLWLGDIGGVSEIGGVGGTEGVGGIGIGEVVECKLHRSLW